MATLLFHFEGKVVIFKVNKVNKMIVARMYHVAVNASLSDEARNIEISNKRLDPFNF